MKNHHFLIILLLASVSLYSCRSVDQQTSEPAKAQNEQKREKETKSVDIVTDLPSNQPLTVRSVGENRYHLTVNKQSGIQYRTANDQGFWKWWMFRVDHARGKTLTFEIEGEVNGHKWSTIHPVYMQGRDITDPTSYQPAYWDFIRDTKAREKKLIFRHTFESDRVWVAMRYPFLMEMADKHFQDLKRRLAHEDLPAHVHEIGRTPEGRTMRIIQIGSYPPDEEDPRPTAVLYGREHAQDHDAAWTLLGAIHFLLSNKGEAVRLRNMYNFLIIPTLDRDGAYHGWHSVIRPTFVPSSQFSTSSQSPEARTYMSWFENQWIEKGGRIDFTMTLHNYESSEIKGHVHNWMMEPRDATEQSALMYEKMAHEEFTEAGFDVANPDKDRGFITTRLGGRLVRMADGGVPMGYFVNSQAPNRRLTISEVRQLGREFVETTGKWFSWWQESGYTSSKLNRNKDRIDRLQDRLKNVEKDVEQLRNRIQNAKESLEEERARRSSLSEQMDKLKGLIRQTKEKNKEMNESLEEVRTKLERMKKQIKKKTAPQKESRDPQEKPSDDE